MGETALICSVILALTGWMLYWGLLRCMRRGLRALIRMDMEIRILAGRLKGERKITRQWKQMATRLRGQYDKRQESAGPDVAVPDHRGSSGDVEGGQADPVSPALPQDTQ